jgi:hypothetical protein
MQAWIDRFEKIFHMGTLYLDEGFPLKSGKSIPMESVSDELRHL